eukprot:4361778-Pleurochrysis_carterae.AAC.1
MCARPCARACARIQVEIKHDRARESASVYEGAFTHILGEQSENVVPSIERETFNKNERRELVEG